MDHDGWYGYVYPKSIPYFRSRKLLTPSIASRTSFAFDSEGLFHFVGSGGGGGGGYGLIVPSSTEIAYEYLLGLLNSSLVNECLKLVAGRFRGGYYACSRQYLEQLPIRMIDFSDPWDAARHNEIVSLVQRMLDLHKRVQAAKTAHERGVFQRQIAATDQEIDRLVYELYGLSEDEIAIVEESES